MTDPVTRGFAEAIAERYRLERECGRGATSVVHRAVEIATGRLVAVKVFRPELSAVTGTERFLREVRIEQSLEHPNIISLLDFGELAGVLYCVLPFVDGETLRARLAREGQLPLDDALRITREVGAALTHAHAHGIVHRDVKPENILLAADRALLGDFGIARAIVVSAGERLTDTGVAVGTPEYMSPEQAAADAALDARTDQYALAICAYEMLAGDPPFRGRTMQAISARHLSEPPPALEIVRPNVPEGVIAALERALEKVPADRFGSVEEFSAALASGSMRLERRQRRTRRAAMVVAALAVLGLGWAGWTIGMARPLDASRVVVFPARTAASGSDATEGLRIADAIQVAVEHTEPLRWIPAWESLDSATRADPARLQGADARAIARRRGARYYMMSAIEPVGAGRRLVIWLHDAKGDSLLTQVSAADSTGQVPASTLAIQALPRLLVRMLDPGARVDLSPLSDRRLPAIVKLLDAEEAYRTARFGSAYGLYRQAVVEDSLFAYAALKGAQAASWINRPEEAQDLVALARRHQELLPPKYRPYLDGIEAYILGHADSAVAGFERALAADRYWAEAATALGDAFYHLIPSRAPQDSLAFQAFARAAEIDSLFLPPLFHLAEIAFRNGDGPRGKRHLDRMRRAGAESTWTRHLAVMQRCAEGALSEADWRALAGASADDALVAAMSLAGGARQPACGAAGFRAVLGAPQAERGTVWAAALGLHGALVAMGRPEEAVRLLDSARTNISTQALAFALIGVYADSAFLPLARDAEAFGRERFGTHYATATLRSAWAFGVWEASQKNRAAVEAIALRLDELARTSGAPLERLAAASLNAHLTLLRGDTVGAIRRFGALPIVAPRDQLNWAFLEPLATDRITHVKLLLSQGNDASALDVAAAFDHPQPVALLAFVRESLVLRIGAATRLGRGSVAADLRRRLRALDALAIDPRS